MRHIFLLLLSLISAQVLAQSTPMRVLRASDGTSLAVYSLGKSKSHFLFGVDTGAPVSLVYISQLVDLSDDPALTFSGDTWKLESPEFLGDPMERVSVELWIGDLRRTVVAAVMRRDPIHVGARLVLGTNTLQSLPFRMDFKREVFEAGTLSPIGEPVWSGVLQPKGGRFLLPNVPGETVVVDTGFHVADLSGFTSLNRLQELHGGDLHIHIGPHGRVICANGRTNLQLSGELDVLLPQRTVCGFELDPENFPKFHVLGIKSAVNERRVLTFSPSLENDVVKSIRLDIGR